MPDNHNIDLTTASEWTKNFRDSAPPNSIICQSFDRYILDDILAQTGCEGMRIYYARDDQNKKRLVITGVDSDGNDMYNGILGERAYPTPPTVIAPNPLNS